MGVAPLQPADAGFHSVTVVVDEHQVKARVTLGQVAWTAVDHRERGGGVHVHGP